MTKSELSKKPKKTLLLMAVLRKAYKGGKKEAEKKSKADLVNAVWRTYNKRFTDTKKGQSRVTARKAYKKRSVGRTKFGINVERPKDISEINKKIKDKLLKAGSFKTIEQALDESRYLYVLSFTDNWRKDLGRWLMPVRRRAKNDYCKLVPIANKRLKEKNINHVVFSKICKR